MYNLDSQGAFRILAEGFTLLVALHFMDRLRFLSVLRIAPPLAYLLKPQ